MEKKFNSNHTSGLTQEEIEQEIVRLYNDGKGNDDQYCDKCKQRGDFLEIRNGNHYYIPCECVKSAYNQNKLSRIGVDITKTLDNFNTVEPFQQKMYNSAMKFLDDKNTSIYIGGQVGCGKTHIGGGLLIEMIKQGYSAKYMKWKQDVIKLKRYKNDKEYEGIINEYLEPDILYIDDLFKTTRGSMPTSADADIAYEIIDYRNSKGKRNIISCELYLDEIYDIDEAIASRIKENSILVNIKRDKKRDQRQKGELI